MNLTASFTSQQIRAHQSAGTVKTRKLMWPLIAVALLTISFTPVSAQTNAEAADSERQSEAQPIYGSSLPGSLARLKTVRGTFIGKANAVIDGNMVPYIFTETFHDDGTVESNASIELAPPAASTARGQYQYLGGNQFAVTTVGTLVNSATDPTLFGTFRIRQLVLFNDRRDQIIDDRIQVDIFDTDGNLLFSFNATPAGPARMVTVELPQ